MEEDLRFGTGRMGKGVVFIGDDLRRPCGRKGRIRVAHFRKKKYRSVDTE